MAMWFSYLDSFGLIAVAAVCFILRYQVLSFILVAHILSTKRYRAKVFKAQIYKFVSQMQDTTTTVVQLI